MSFSDRPTLTGPQKFGCFIVAAVGIVVTFMGLILAALGHCAPEADGTGCESDGIIKFIAFPGTAIFFLVLGAQMIWFFMRDKD